MLRNHRAALHSARIVPKTNEIWFSHNSMAQFSLVSDRTGVNDIANGIALRSDVHKCFDRHGFVFYPLETASDNESTTKSTTLPRYVAVFIKTREAPYRIQYHRREVHMDKRISEEFLFARFALAIISLNALHTGLADVAFPVPARLQTLLDRSLVQGPSRGTEEASQPSDSHEHQQEETSDVSSIDLETDFTAQQERWQSLYTQRFPDLCM